MKSSSELNLPTQFKGTITELQVAADFLSKGYNISFPLCSDSKYDIILDTGEKLLRIQVKTSRESPEGNSIVFNCRSTTTNTRNNIKRRYSEDEVDFFATYWDGKTYLVPVKECSSEKRLHFITEQTRRKNWSYMDNYETEVVLNSL